MINVIKKEIDMEESLRKRLEIICDFCNTKAIIINGRINNIEHTNLNYIEPHRVIIKGITFLVFNYSKTIYVGSLANSLEIKNLEDLISHLDGVVLEGGVSNQYEEEIAKICIKKDIPILGICSGFNNLIIAMGGSVHIDDNIFHNQFGLKIAHDIEILKNSKLFHIMNEKN